MSARASSRWMTVPEVCAWLKVTPQQWAEWRAAGDTPLHLVGDGGQLLVRVADLNRWLDAHTTEPSEPLPG